MGEHMVHGMVHTLKVPRPERTMHCGSDHVSILCNDLITLIKFGSSVYWMWRTVMKHIAQFCVLNSKGIYTVNLFCCAYCTRNWLFWGSKLMESKSDMEKIGLQLFPPKSKKKCLYCKLSMRICINI